MKVEQKLVKYLFQGQGATRRPQYGGWLLRHASAKFRRNCAHVKFYYALLYQDGKTKNLSANPHGIFTSKCTKFTSIKYLSYKIYNNRKRKCDGDMIMLK
uniref:Uncharacterized protein n=1 Tax=Cacopsylla melanoneura TaxID=428564 RepID=A0A8D8S2L6_9HEMI